MVLAMALMAGCSAKEEAETTQTADAAKTGAADKADETKVVQPCPPGNIRASHILISHSGAPRTGATRSKEEAKALAEEIKGKLAAGESFEELAKAYSDCPSAQKGGDLGFFGKGQMVPPFEKAAFGLEVGDVSDIVETQFGYHIIKRTQ
jgi:parvulin-like peptidyl-prolyl isomerase